MTSFFSSKNITSHIRTHVDTNIYGQYRCDIFSKVPGYYEQGKRILDIGCGSGNDADIFHRVFGLKTYGIDIYEDENIVNVPGLIFKKADITRIPFPDNYFDYIWLHDVLHHIDEVHQNHDIHLAALREVRRVVARGGTIFVVEANRYNPLFYVHMVKMLGHEHWTQQYFRSTIREIFPHSCFFTFEAHAYPARYIAFWKLYETVMERWSPSPLLAYNTAIIKNDRSCQYCVG